MRSIEEVIEELNKELFSIGEQVGEEIKSGKINDTPYSRGMLQGIAIVAVCVENRGNEILEIHKAEQQKWIPVDERLPEHSEATYLICTDGGYMCSCRWTNDRYGLGSHPGSDWGWHKMDKPQFGKIVAWMPLKPYKA